MDGQAGREGRIGGGVGQEVVDAGVPTLAEFGAAHADDRHLVADAFARHAYSSALAWARGTPRRGRAFQK